MKKILFSILSLGVVAVVAIGATRAYFTTQDVLSGSTISTATLSIRTGTKSDLPIKLTNLLPGVWTEWQDIIVVNDSGVPIKYAWSARLYSGNELYEQVNVQIQERKRGWSGYTTTYGSELYGSPLKGLVLKEARTYLNAGEVMEAQVRFRLPASTGNAFQGKQTTFQFILDATQVDNPGWSE